MAARARAGRPWSYGAARTLLALGTASTLAANPAAILFREAAGAERYPFCSGPAAISAFCLVPPDALDSTRVAAVLMLILVAAGWRPRWTAIPHWWVSFSLQVSAVTIDGGDQITAVLTLLLVPVALLDPRRWHWDASPAGAGPARVVIAHSARTAIRVQVAGIYFHAAVAKMRVPEWYDGTAVYYWFTDPFFGAPAWLAPALWPVLTTGVTVALVTWGAILLEVLLFMALVMSPRRRARLVGPALLFHLLIAIVHGLVSFGLAMSGAVLLYLWPPDGARRRRAAPGRRRVFASLSPRHTQEEACV